VIVKDVDHRIEELTRVADSRRRQLDLLFDLTHASGEAREVIPLVDRMLGKIHAAMAVDTAVIHLVDGTDLVTAGARLSERAGIAATGIESAIRRLPIGPDSLVGHAASTRQTLRMGVDSLPAATRPAAASFGVRFGMATPLVTSDELVGTLSVSRCTETEFTDEEMHLLESCAGHLAVTISHARLYEDERRRVRDLELINELGALIAQHLELPAVLSTGVRNLARLADVPNAFLMLLDAAHTELRMVATNVDDPGVLSIRIPLDKTSAATSAVHLLRPVIIDSSRTDERADPGLADRFGHIALLAVPLLSQGQPLGAVVLGETRADRTFSPDEVGRAVAVSNQLATAIAHAKTFDDLRKSYDKLALAQAELVTHERLAALGELAAVMAHEVRNPLAVIYNSLGSLRKLLQPTGDARVLIDIAGQEAERLNRIVGDLLDFAKPYAPVVRTVQLAALVQGAVDGALGAIDSSGIEVRTEIADELPLLELDGHMLRQALVNLVVNAIQATPKGRCVTVHAGVEKRNGTLGARLDIVDQGAGIAPQDVEQIFQPFFTTKATGTGLGLAVVRRIVEAHRGRVDVRPEPQGGTAFTLWLPSSVEV
jgi:signal transduction histidine kinase